MEEHFLTSILSWLLDLPIDLGNEGLVDEALGLCTQLADAQIEPAAVLAQKGIVLARAERHAEAVAQVDHNLAAYPLDVDVLERGADTLMLCGDDARAETMLRKVIEIADEEDPFYAIQARDDLADLLRRHDRAAEAAALEQEARERMEELGDIEDGDEV